MLLEKEEEEFKNVKFNTIYTMKCEQVTVFSTNDAKQ